MTKVVTLPFEIAEDAHIDGGDIVGVVTAYSISARRVLVEVAWLHNGDAKSAYFDDWRLSSVEEHAAATKIKGTPE